MFVDKVVVDIRAGRGGDGCVSFRHEKYIDKGGPDGGDGGKGADIIFVGSHRMNTLAMFRYQKEITAKDGAKGSKRKKHGRSAIDLEVQVPVGTSVYRSGNLVADIIEEGQKIIIAHGGRGGFGNAHFISSKRQTPRVAEKGEPGEEFESHLELKLIAQVGLIGLPNAGKSTLLSVVTNAKPEIADYPFTTIKPNLGVALVSEGKSVLIADIPGLIEGASEGKGLGDDFLRHVERTKVLVHLIDAYQDDVAEAYCTVRNELKKYKIDLVDRPEIIVLSKIDGLDEEIIADKIKSLKKVVNKQEEIVAISSKSRQGLKDLLFRVLAYVEKEEEKDAIEFTNDALPIITLDSNDLSWKVKRTDKGKFVVVGKKIEKFAVRTDFDNYAGVERLRNIMRKMGIIHELERQGINADDLVVFGESGEFGNFNY